MASDVVVSVEIDEPRKQALFDKKVFKAERGQTVRWELQLKGGRPRDLGSRAARIRFKSLPETRQPLLEGGLEGGTVFPAQQGVISAVVDRQAPDFTYMYVLELGTGSEATELQCVWGDGERMTAAGGEPSGGGKKGG